MANKLFIVSNRLPVTVSDDAEVMQASGGLVSAMGNYLDKINASLFDKVYWAGIPGCGADIWRSKIDAFSPSTFTYIPVFVDKREYDGYYNGHSNSVLWPLFHYFPSYAEYEANFYPDYQHVNHCFADALIEKLGPADTVWIHDYHLLPLAAFLREAIPRLTIGFFLHIPFPSFEIFRLLPRKWQEDHLQGMLGADLIGFHTIDYAAHFLQCCLMVLGIDNERNIIQHNDRLIKVDVFPISIDFEKFNQSFYNQQAYSIKQTLKANMPDRKIIFSIDRLDYTKGIHNRLKAYQAFLTQNVEYHGKVVFIMVVIPSRDSIQKYAERKKMIDETISDINSKIGNIYWVPVIYQYNSLSFEELVALYTACDVALITPLRDGMNLVSKEFVASRKDKRGVLILSEMAGAARELTDAILINPNDIPEMANKIKEGLEMDEIRQERAMAHMQKRIANYDVTCWAEDFMNELRSIKHKQQSFQIKFIDETLQQKICSTFRESKKRLFLLDYDGTLVSFCPNPDMAIPGEDLIRLIASLCHDDNNDVFIISGRNSKWLERYFGNLPINLIAEHGARYKWKNEEWLSDIQTHNEWKEKVSHIMEIYVRRCVNSFIEEKDFSMVWHYRNASVYQGKLRAAELVNELNDSLHDRRLEVLPGNKIIEVRQSGINKGTCISKIIENQEYDFIFAVGDDRTDEDMFKALMNKNDAVTIKVGSGASYAHYNLEHPENAVALLKRINNLSLKNRPLEHSSTHRLYRNE